MFLPARWSGFCWFFRNRFRYGLRLCRPPRRAARELKAVVILIVCYRIVSSSCPSIAAQDTRLARVRKLYLTPLQLPELRKLTCLCRLLCRAIRPLPCAIQFCLGSLRNWRIFVFKCSSSTLPSRRRTVRGHGKRLKGRPHEYCGHGWRLLCGRR